MSGELREEIARAMFEAKWDAQKVTWSDAPQSVRAVFHGYAQSVLPIIERVRDEARAEVIKWVEDDATVCDCMAHGSHECGCGAWDDCKTVSSQRLVEQLRDTFVSF